jgi:hypothetical protein
MPNDNHAEAIASQNSATELAFKGAFITTITLLAYHATSARVIKTCDLGGIFHAHCSVYAMGFSLGALQLALFLVFGRKVHMVRVAISSVMLLIFIFGSMVLQSHATHHRQRVFHDRPACRHMLKDSALAFSWYTYAVLDLMACVSSSLVLAIIVRESTRALHQEQHVDQVSLDDLPA